MGNSKVIFGNETLIDLTGDTVTPDTLLAGTTAHNRSGEQIVGTATVPDTLDDLTDVELTSPAAGDLLQRNGNGEWVNSAAIPNALAAVRNNGAYNLMRNDAISATISGITFTVDDDGIITGNGTSTAAIQFDLQGNTYKSLSELGLVANKPYIISGGIQNLAYFRLSSGGSWASIASSDNVGTAFTIPDASYTYRPQLFIPSGTTLNNHKFKPMVYDAALGFSLPYQPNAETNPVLTKKVAGLQKTGCVNILRNDATSQVISGITWTVDENGIIDANGTATANTSVVINTVIDAGAIVDNAFYQNILHKKLKFVGCPSGGAINTFYLAFNRIDNNDSSAVDTGDGVVFDFEKTTMTGRSYITAYIYSGQTVNHIKFKPMLTFDLSATYDDYQPYSMTNRELTEAVTPVFHTDITLNSDVIKEYGGYYTYGKLVNLQIRLDVQTAISSGVLISGLPVPAISAFASASDSAFSVFNSKGVKLNMRANGSIIVIDTLPTGVVLINLVYLAL